MGVKNKNIEDFYPLSPMQQGILYHSLAAPKSGTYFEQFSWNLHGSLNIRAFHQSWQHIVKRHSILRTCFVWEGLKEPVQVVHRQVTLAWQEYNWQHLSPDEQQQKLRVFLESDRSSGFELTQPPLMRLTLVQLSDTSYNFTWSHHHLLLDGWSGAIIFKEVFACYTALSKGEDVFLEPIRPYRDYIVWLQQQNLSVAETYWRETLKGFTTPTRLWADPGARKSLTPEDDYAEQEIKFSAVTTTALESIAQRHQLTLNILVQGAWVLLLSCYSGHEDIVFGAVASGRPPTLPHAESMVGLFINTLPIRVKVSPQEFLLPWLQKIQTQLVEARQYEYSPLVKVQGWSEVPKGFALFDNILAFENYPVDPSVLEKDINFEIEDFHGFERTNYPVTLTVIPGNELLLKISYDDRDRSDTVTRMLGHLQTLLEGMVNNPQQRLCQLSLLTETERHQLLVEWNNTEVEYPQQQCIHELFEAQVERTPDAVAVVFEDAQLTYLELNIRANQLAHYLQKVGVKPELLVGICVERSLDMLIGLLAILKAGGAYIPLDPHYPQERLAFILEDTQASVLLTQASLLATIPQHQAQTICLDTNWQLISPQSQKNLSSQLSAENLAYIIYTSGSTGKPKGVQIPHIALNNFLFAMKQSPGINTEDILLAVTTYSFDIAALELFLPIIVGARLVIVSREVAADGIQLSAKLTNFQATFMQATPATWQLLLAAGWSGNQQLKILCGGEALPAYLANQLLERCACLWNMYGPTETTIWSAASLIKTINGNVTISQPITNTQIYILDPYDQLVPVGVPGQVCIAGDGLAQGYFHRPDLTAEKFIPNPFSTKAARLYKTGDLARYLPNGEIEYLGRIDHQVKVRGFRIELGEIEAVLSQHPTIRETVVTVREDSIDSQRLVAYVVPQQQQTLTIPELSGFLVSRLPNYMVPTAFVILEALPLTPNGKVDRQALPAPELTQSLLSSSSPSTPTENLLAGIWAEVIGIDKVGTDQNFFELGGHSLIATRVISQIRQVFSVELPLRCLFEKPTIAGLATEIENAIKTGFGLETTNIERIGRSPQLPLSFAQQRLWFLAQLEPDSPFYNIPAAVRLEGELNFNALQQSFNEILRRHETLRTNFPTMEGKGIAVISEVKPLMLPILDISELSFNHQEDEVKQQVGQEAQQSFDISSDHLLRVKLLRLGEQEHLLLLTMHHIVSDGWSMGVLIKEVAALYEAFAKEQPISGQDATQIPLAELPIQYVDFTAWQRQWLQGEVLQSQISYWRSQLEDAPKVLELPTDYPRPAIQTFPGATYSFELSKELSASLNKLSQQQGSTLFMTLLAAFQTLLWRYTGSEDIVVGSPIANRNRTEIEGLIGCFVNTLVLRTKLTGNPSFKELLKRVREVALGAYAHQDLPFELLVEKLQPQRDLSHTPLFQVMFVLQNAPLSALELPGLNLLPLESNSDSAKFDLTLNMSETELGIVGSLEYNTNLFTKTSIHKMAGHLQTLLSGIVANPQQRLSQLPLLTETELHQQLLEWNNTAVEYPQEQGIHELFEAQVERTPDAVAVVFEDAQLTYLELNIRANQLAHYLQKVGVKPELLVGICVERSLDMLIGLLAILKAGGAYIPLDPNYPQERLAFILEDTQASVLLTQASLLATIPQHQAQTICLDTNWQLISQQSQKNLSSQLSAENLAYIIYTSGSTGKPKGVQIPHIALNNFLFAMKQSPGITKEDTLLAVTTYSFDIAALELFLPIIVGARLVIVSREVAADGIQLSAKLTNSQTTVMQATPATWQLLLAAGWSGNQQLKILCGGEALAAHLANQLLERCASVWNMYGPTETTIWSAASEVKTVDGTVKISQPIANTELYILDQYNQLLPVGVPGQLCIAGDGLARGYFHRSDITAEKFIPHPFSDKPSARLYLTGDLARYLPNGDIEYLGRIDNQVKLRGFRIELGEIEAVIIQHPAVRETVVTVYSSEADSQSLVAYVVPQTEQTLAIKELRGLLESQLPNYMIPGAFVILEALPLTPNGKVNRKALPAPQFTQILPSSQSPSTPIEILLAGIWTELLGINHVGIGDNFFELGGHSLIATRVISQIRQVFSVELPLRCLFEKPTIAGLAKEIENGIQVGLGVERINIERIARLPHSPLSFAQQRLWFLAQLEPDSPFYNIFAAVRLQGELNIQALQQTFNEIVSRHKALRTKFKTVEGQAVTIISEATPLKLPQLDLSQLPANQQEYQVKQQTLKAAQQPFDLTTDVLLRVKLLRLGQQEHIALLTMHHIAADAWSVGVLVQELATLYPAFCNGQLSPLIELPIQYVDFAAWQRQWLQGEILQSQLAYWLKHLENAPAILELPTDYTRPAIQTFQGATYSFNISPELSTALNKLSQQQGITLFMTLFAAFQTLLWHYTGQDDIVVGSPIANRNQGQIEELIGLFVNTLVLRTNLAGNPRFEELLQQVREVALGAYAHQDLPFELLVEELQPERSLSDTPLFQVMFVLQNAPMSALDLPGLNLSLLETISDTAKFDLTLYLTETNSGLVGNLEYNTDLFKESSIHRMVENLQTLLAGIVANPQQRLSELPFLSDWERHQLLVEWNNTELEYPQQQCIHELFQTQVEKTPDAVAIVFENEQLTYCELNQRANQLAHYLQKLGVKPEVLVGICVQRSLDMVIGLLAILKAGGAYIPLDPHYPQERLAFILENAQVSVLLTQTSLLAEIPQHQAQTICLDTDWQLISPQIPENLCSQLTSENLAYIIYTSGSTGKPKGVQIPHIALNNFLFSMQQSPGITKEDTLLAVTTYSFDIAALELFLPIIVGARLVIVSREVAADGIQLSAKLTNSQATVMQATPATWQLLLAAGWSGNQQLKILCGGEALPTHLANQLLERCASVWNMYGPTETTIWSAASEVKTVDGTVKISQPIANTELYILDQYNQLVPVGVTGELHIGGDGLARGYFLRPDITAEKFIPHPYPKHIGERLYKTGDLARYLANGEIEYIGRIDYQVKLRGFRIELGEIEAVISQYPAVLETIVTLRKDTVDSQSLVAYVVPEKEQTVTIKELRGFLESKLPSYMIPGAFVTLEALPLTPNGKVDRKALPKPNLTLGSSLPQVTPNTQIEILLAGIWAEILGLDKVGIHDNFFELGGHSLIATRVMSRIRQVFQVELPLRDLFAKPTIAGLATEIETANKAGLGTQTTNIERIERWNTPQLPLSFAQQRLWFLAQLEPNSPFYNIPAAVRLQGELNFNALRQSFNEIVRRHEVLRTNFQTVAGQAVVVISQAKPLILPTIDISKLPLDQQEVEIKQQTTQELQHPFNISSDYLLRVKLLRLDEQEHILLLTMHHIVSDRWSIGVLVQEVSALYTAFCAGKPASLPELPIQYVDFAMWQRQWLQGEVLQSQLAYWKKQLGSNLPVLQLPTIRPRSEVKTNSGKALSFVISSQNSKALQALSRQEGVTLFMTLLAGFNVLLQRYTNQDDIVVGTDVANRNRAEIEPLIGFFVNLLVLRTHLGDNPSFRELLKQVRSCLLGAYAHQDLPFDELVKALQPERNLNNTSPLFQVLFVLQNTPMPPLELPGLTLHLLEVESKIAKFDLALFLTETEEGILGEWQYNADLFDEKIISCMTEHFKTLLNSIVAQPDTKINNLEMLTDSESKQQAMQKKERKAFKREKFMSVSPKAINLLPEKLIKIDYFQPGQILPLVIQPNDDEINLVNWVQNNREFIEKELLKHGAILFRGFDVDSESKFQSFAQAIYPDLFGEYGDLPRKVKGSKVYGSTPYPSDKAILFHNESSHSHQFPLKIWFCCLQASEQGGETPIVDCRQAYQKLNPKLRDRLVEKQLLYVRHYTGGLDVSWQEFFQTDDKLAVENYCNQAKIDFTWYNNDSLVTRQIRPALAVHPKTGDKVFFNQIQLHHISYLDAEVRKSLLSLYKDEELPRNVYYGDGTPIEESVITEINEIYQQCTTSFSWQKRDVLMLDNMLAAHGRYPYLGQRKIIVAMGEMVQSENVLYVKKKE